VPVPLLPRRPVRRTGAGAGGRHRHAGLKRQADAVSLMRFTLALRNRSQIRKPVAIG
jgi:hypothetical protein